MTRTTRPLAGVTPDDIDTQRRLARALVEHDQVGAAQDAVLEQAANALLQAGFVRTAAAEPLLETLGNGAQRDLASEWVEPINDVQLLLRCTFYARFGGPQTGHTRLSLTMTQKPEAGASRLDAGVAAHLLVSSTPPPASRQFEAHPEVPLLAHWEQLGLLVGGNWGDTGPAEFVKLANSHFAR